MSALEEVDGNLPAVDTNALERQCRPGGTMLDLGIAFPMGLEGNGMSSLQCLYYCTFSFPAERAAGCKRIGTSLPSLQTPGNNRIAHRKAGTLTHIGFYHEGGM